MDLRARLDHFRKADLQDIGDVLGSSLPSRLGKAKMADRLSEYLHNQPGRWLSFLMERDIRLLRDLVHAGPERVRYMDFADYPSIVEVSGIVEYDDSDEHYHKVWISREMYDVISPHIDAAIRTGEKNGQYEIERMGLGYLNLYGILPTETFLDFLMDWYSNHFGNDFSYLSSVLRQSPLMKLCRFDNSWGDNVVSPCISDVEEMFSLREEYCPKEKYPVFPDELVSEAGAGAPYFTVCLQTPEGKALEEVYRKVGYAGFELVKAEHDTWIEAQYPSSGNSDILGPLYDAPHIREFSDSQWDSFCQVVADYADSVPKWCLRGRSAREAGECLVDRNAPYDDYDYYDEKDSPSEEYPRWNVLSSDFPMGFAVPHVAPDDPCPCGSGLRYCRCHGKYLS